MTCNLKKILGAYHSVCSVMFTKQSFGLFLFSLGRVTLHELINVTVTGLDVGDGCVKLLRGWCSIGLHTVSVLVCILVQCWSAYDVYTNT